MHGRNASASLPDEGSIPPSPLAKKYERLKGCFYFLREMSEVPAHFAEGIEPPEQIAKRCEARPVIRNE